MKITPRIVAVAVCGVALLSGCQAETNGHPVQAPPVFRMTLRHTAVEQFIEANYGVTGVTCNGGENITIPTHRSWPGKTFTCEGAGGTNFSVKLTDSTGAYEVSPG